LKKKNTIWLIFRVSEYRGKGKEWVSEYIEGKERNGFQNRGKGKK
jgi:hypothetical protein